MWLPTALLIVWTLVFLCGKRVWRAWTAYRVRQPARFISEIQGLEYFRRLPAARAEQLVLQALKAHKYTILDDPFLRGSEKQGYAWRAGKKAIVVFRQQGPLQPSDLVEIAKSQRKFRAEVALVLTPYDRAPYACQPGMRVLAGRDLICWFGVLDSVVPPVTSTAPTDPCECGAPMRERVNRLGQVVMFCSTYPCCRGARRFELTECRQRAG